MTGNIVATSSPILIPNSSVLLTDTISETKPVIHGDKPHPISPNIARKANMAVLPLGNFFDDMLSTPGHITLIANPHIAQAIREMIGIGANAAVR